MSDAASLRRYYVLERMATRQAGLLALSAVWQSKQEAAPAGVSLPDDFPNKAELNAAGYEASEDLIGADIQELADYAGLSDGQSADVLATLAALTAS